MESSSAWRLCMLLRVRVIELGSDVVVCVPCPDGFCLFSKEKTLVEATTRLLLQRRTSQADQERQIVEIWVRGGYLVAQAKKMAASVRGTRHDEPVWASMRRPTP